MKCRRKIYDSRRKSSKSGKNSVVNISFILADFERIMMESLIKIDESKVIHETPLQCLLAFCQ